LCREEALDLVNVYESRKSAATLFGIIKEVAPTSQAENDTVLGVGAFEQDYFPYPLYLDSDKGFYAYLGNRKLVTPRLFFGALLNPIRAYRGVKSLGERIRAKNIEGNLVGEGNLQGGVLVVSPKGDVLFSYQEKTGSVIPKDDIAAAIDSL